MTLLRLKKEFILEINETDSKIIKKRFADKLSLVVPEKEIDEIIKQQPKKKKSN